MAAAAINTRRWGFSILVAFAATAMVALLPGPLGKIEHGITSFKYHIRGERTADTNVVIIYIDNDAVKTLGWPVRRNFHALIIKALTDLNARAIGVEMLFEQEASAYPEYDRLLQRMIGDANRVVLSCYFEKLTEGNTGKTRWAGDGLHLPLPALAGASAGIGHLNLTDDGGVPLIVNSGEMNIPAFGLEILKVSGKNPPSLTGIEPTILPDYPGPITTFALYPFLEVLRSYDAILAGEEPQIPVQLLKDKVVLIGVIAEGRSAVVSTPFDPRFPSVGVHATVVENLLRNRQLMVPSELTTLIAAFLIALLCCAIPLIVPAVGAGTGIAVAAALILVSSQLLFTTLSCDIPAGGLVACAVVGGTAAAVYRNRRVKDRVAGLEAEKEAITADLRDKEARVALLERELLDAASRHPTEKTQELQAEIRRYKAEIRELAGRVDDMVPYDPPAESADLVSFEGIVGSRRGPVGPVIEFIEKIAGSDAPVVILGESGTGKELVAKALHKRSGRSNAPFVAVNCGALTESLLESELFGHEKGSFTGAVKERAGRFELADGGTIFLDEIGDVNEAFQVKLLRVLQEGTFERVGGTSTRRVNVRVLAATNRDLKDLMSAGKFREDLYYRLNVLSLEVPPLRERGDDIRLLTGFFLDQEARGLHLSKNVMAFLTTYPWPGNVRELQSVLKRGALLALAEGRTMVTVKDLPEDLRALAVKALNMDEQIMDSVRTKLFSRSAVSETAEELGGLNRGTVAEYLRGECLRMFVEHGFDLDATVGAVSLSTDPAVNERVRRRMTDYLENIAEAVDLSKPWDFSKAALLPKKKNLPQRYHEFLEQAAEGRFRGLWKL